MKKITFLLILSVVALVSGCGQKQEEVKPRRKFDSVIERNMKAEAKLGLTGTIVEQALTGTVETGAVETGAVECEKKKVRYFYYKFNENTKTHYQSYINAPKYCFAHRLTIDGVPYGYINVIRNKAGGVSNYLDMQGCIAGKDIARYDNNDMNMDMNMFFIIEGDDYKFAVDKPGVGYTTKTIPNDINTIVIKNSGVKEGIELIDSYIVTGEVCVEDIE